MLEYHQQHLLKLLYVFYLTELGRADSIELDQCILREQFFMTAVHFRFQCLTLKVDYIAQFNDFFNFQSRATVSCYNG